MFLKKLTTKSFRNLENQDIEFFPGVNLILGENGQGKTSILEAIYLLSQGKSFREAKNKNITKWGLDIFEVDADFTSIEGTKNLLLNFEKSKKTVKINKNKISAAEDFYGNFTCVCFTPDDLMLIKGAPAERRKFVDQILAMISPKYIHSLVTYQRALKNRNLILKSSQEKSEATPWEKILVEYGLIVAELRAEFIKAIKEFLIYYYQKISNNEQCDLIYNTEFINDTRLLSKEELLEIYKQSFLNDLKRGTTRVGIHRDNIDFYLNFEPNNFVDARYNASQGQARSLSLAAKIAAAKFVSEKKHEPPVLLLDDVQSELDKHRLNRLFELLFSLEGQVIITATEKEKLPIFNAKQSHEFLIKKGRLYS